MAVTEPRHMSLKEFLELPEEKPALELEADGTVTQKMSPKGSHSTLQTDLAELINRFARPRRLARAFSELRTIFGSAAYVPDVSVYRWDRIARRPSGRIAEDFTEPPDIAVEIVSPGQSINALVRRCVWYVDNGVRIAMLIDPDDESILVFRAGANPIPVQGSEPVDLADVLPGFQLTPAELFASLKIDDVSERGR